MQIFEGGEVCYNNFGSIGSDVINAGGQKFIYPVVELESDLVFEATGTNTWNISR